MLECSYCNYYSVQNGKKMCEFSDYIFVKNPLDMNKYPCDNISYQSYLSKNEDKEDESIVA